METTTELPDKDVTYLNTQGVRRLGYTWGETHPQTGEVLVYDTRTNSPVYIQPGRVFFLD